MVHLVIKGHLAQMELQDKMEMWALLELMDLQ